MEIVKAQFDQRPSLVEFEGTNIRINFDIEKSTAVNNMMDEGEPETRDICPLTS